ncbi:MAG: type II secretion system F family protein [Ilumatobacteraceae bacterium]
MNNTVTFGATVGLVVVLVTARLTGRLRSLPRGRTPSRSGRRVHYATSDYAVLLDAIARQVRSGRSLTGAVLDEIDRGTPLRAVIDRLTDGESLVDALAGTVTSEADLALMVQALSATAHLGGPVAATLDEAAAVLRERAAARAERRAHASQARLSARVLTVVPVVFAVWSAAGSQRTRDVYISTAAGSISALCGLALNVAGWQWMKRIIGPS